MESRPLTSTVCPYIRIYSMLYRRKFALTHKIRVRLAAVFSDVKTCSPHVPRLSFASWGTKQASLRGGGFGYSAKASVSFGESSSVGKTTGNTSATSKGTDETSLEARYWQYIRVRMPRTTGATQLGKLLLFWTRLCDTGGAFRLKRFLTDEIPSSQIVGMSLLFQSMTLLYAWAMGIVVLMQFDFR